MAHRKSVVVTVSDAALKDIKGVADQLAAKGMAVDRVMPITGTITGTCPATTMAALGGTHGVTSVEEELGVQLPPPGSPIQ